MKPTFAEKAILFNKNLSINADLPINHKIINPFDENSVATKLSSDFYHKFYNDFNQRKFIIGINPGRFGGALTGIPFTDSKRLSSHCGIHSEEVKSHEVSSVFIYDLIDAYGGVKKFYGEFYINSPLPLALVKEKSPEKWVNANYYDSPALFAALKDEMMRLLIEMTELNLDTSKVFVLGKKNAKFIEKLNHELSLFQSIVVLEHPRYIQQYKSKEKQLYIDKYIEAFSQ